MCDKIPNLKHVVILPNPAESGTKIYDGTWQFSKLNEHLPNGSVHELPKVEFDDPCLILFTVSFLI